MYSVSPSHSSFFDASVVTRSFAPLAKATSASPLSMPVRISGPLVSSAIATSRPSSGVSFTDWRTFATTDPWYSYDPCEKFIRATLRPASRSIVNFSTSFVFGPIVHTTDENRCWLGAE